VTASAMLQSSAAASAAQGSSGAAGKEAGGIRGGSGTSGAGGGDGDGDAAGMRGGCVGRSKCGGGRDKGLQTSWASKKKKRMLAAGADGKQRGLLRVGRQNMSRYAAQCQNDPTKTKAHDAQDAQNKVVIMMDCDSDCIIVEKEESAQGRGEGGVRERDARGKCEESGEVNDHEHDPELQGVIKLSLLQYRSDTDREREREVERGVDADAEVPSPIGRG